jgi:hypothetical protein
MPIESSQFRLCILLSPWNLRSLWSPQPAFQPRASLGRPQPIGRNLGCARRLSCSPVITPPPSVMPGTFSPLDLLAMFAPFLTPSCAISVRHSAFSRCSLPLWNPVLRPRLPTKSRSRIATFSLPYSIGCVAPSPRELFSAIVPRHAQPVADSGSLSHFHPGRNTQIAFGSA